MCLEDNANSVVLMVIWRMVVVVSVGSGAPCVPRDLADLVYGIEPVRPRAPQIIAVPGPSQAGFTAEVPLVEESRGAGDWTDVVRGTRGASQAAQAERLTSTSDKRLCRPNSPGDGVGHNESYWLSIPYGVRDTFLGLWIPRSLGSMDAGISVRTGEPGWSWGGLISSAQSPTAQPSKPLCNPDNSPACGFSVSAALGTLDRLTLHADSLFAVSMATLGSTSMGKSSHR